MVNDRRGFGEQLKRQRERAGITLQQIAQTTKVPVSLFAGLEAGDCSRWPAGLYARAYVRAYATAIGLNTEEAVEDFAAAFGNTLKSDGIEAAPALSARAPGALRLSLVEDPAAAPVRFAKRAGLAAVDLLIGLLIATIAHAGFGAAVWMTVTAALSYYAIGRLVSDEPLLYWLYCRAKQQLSGATPAEVKPADVAVGDPASTTA